MNIRTNYCLIIVILLFSVKTAKGLQKSRLGFQQSGKLSKFSKKSPFIQPCLTKKPEFRRSFFSSLPEFSKLSFSKEKNLKAEYFINKPKKEQKELLYIILGQKILGEESTFLSNETLDDIIERLAEEGYINDADRQGNTPLMIVIQKTTPLSNDLQKKIVEKLYNQGADLSDQNALALTIKNLNLGALEVMQPHFGLKYLYPEFKNVLADYTSTIKKIAQMNQSPHLKKVYEIYRNLLKNVLEILNKPVQPIIVHAHVFKNGKEQDDYLEISSTGGLYMFEKNYSKNAFELDN